MREVHFLHLIILILTIFKIMCKARCGSRVKLLRLKILHINNRAQTLISFLFNFLLFLNWAEIVADVLLHLLRHPHPLLHIFILFRIWGEH